jgi:hypothetical protein
MTKGKKSLSTTREKSKSSLIRSLAWIWTETKILRAKSTYSKSRRNQDNKSCLGKGRRKMSNRNNRRKDFYMKKTKPSKERINLPNE